jgi:hypothetical protein
MFPDIVQWLAADLLGYVKAYLSDSANNGGMEIMVAHDYTILCLLAGIMDKKSFHDIPTPPFASFVAIE